MTQPAPDQNSGGRPAGEPAAGGPQRRRFQPGSPPLAKSISSTVESRSTARPGYVKSRENRTREDELEYFNVRTKCLGCGRATRVQIDQLHRMLRCRKWGTIMHMAADGNWYEGAPPELTPLAAQQFSRSGAASRLRLLSARYPVLKQRWLHLAIAGCMLAVLLVAGVRWTLRNQFDLPEELPARAAWLAEGIVRGDSRGFRQLMHPDSSYAGELFVEQVRNNLSGGEGEITFQIQPIFENREENIAGVSVSFGGGVSHRCLLYWTRSADDWVLDGKRTLDQYKEGNR